jgi:galacturan 1,4-alpha-galacturonidase
VNIYGGGTLDGNGQVWYDLYAQNIYTLRPVLIGVDGLHNSIVSDLVLRYSPEYYHFVANSTNVIFDNINIGGGSKSANIAKNTDGWDTYRSSDITIQNSVINNGDGKQITLASTPWLTRKIAYHSNQTARIF